MSERPHVLLAVTAGGDALALVEQAWRVAAGLGAGWSIVAIDTPATETARAALRGPLLQALDRAQQLGAAPSRISTGSHTTSAMVSALVHRARSVGATTLMIGCARGTGGGWLPGGRGLGELAEVLAQQLPGVCVHVVCPPAATRPARAWARTLRWSRPGLRDAARVVLALGVATAAAAALERHLHPANLVMLFLAAVVYVASRAGRAPAVATVLGSIFIYDLIFVAPRWSLKPTEPQYWLAFLVMMVAGLIVGQLAARSREQALLAEARARRTQALNELSVALGRARDRAAVAQALCEAVQAAVGTRADVLFVVDGACQRPAAGAPEGFDDGCAAQAIAGGSETGAGTPVAGTQPLRYVPLRVGERTFALLVHPMPAPAHDALEDQHLVRALANQAAVALERAELEARSIAAAVEAEGERTRNTLLAGISHDFRTPLTTIVGSATTLIEQAPALDEAHRASLLRGLLDEARRLHTMTSNLLDLTRLDAGAIQLRPEWCPADELLDAALRQLEPRLRAHRLEARVPPEALVWCDPRLIDQVIVNLVDNAVRHTPAGGTIRVAIEPDARRWTLTVHDDGPGIPAGHERAIFRKFHRAAGDGDSTGQGLGLAICAAIARLHDGEIVAANAQGARFTMTLPQPAPPRLDGGELP
ncbi:MAG: DUF4118 domain-containing protein [Rubrivivax sp.]|nr:DUF4118 domain-containing protein [Rubrivivax sp.]